jgi:hypothetical protein
MELPCLTSGNPLQYFPKEGCDPVLLNRPAGLSGLLQIGGFHLPPQIDYVVVYRKMKEFGRKIPWVGAKSRKQEYPARKN